MGRFAGRRVLITGASRGVGRATALAFAREGADVALLARASEALEDVRARVAEHPVRAIAVPADLADLDAVARVVPVAVAELGSLDVLVSNAAAVVFGPFAEVGAEDFERTVAVSFRGAVAAVQAALPALRESRGAIVATGSLMSVLPLPMFSSYAAAKHALRAWLTALRLDLEREGAGVSVSQVHPGAIATPLWHQLTSATGHLPRFPPEGYRPETVAAALLDCAEKPMNELVLGAETRTVAAVTRAVPPLGRLVLRAMALFYASGREPASAPGALHAPPRGLDRSSRLIPRPSLLETVRRSA